MVAKRVLVIMAHPDDLEDFCGGTLALWADQGSDISVLLLTSGDKGSKDPTLSPAQIGALREREQAASNAVLGIRQTTFLRKPDGMLLPTLELRRCITAEIRRARPEIVVGPDPTRYYFGDYYINHCDHRAAGEALLAAASPSANNRWYFAELLKEGLTPHQVQAVWLTTPSEPNWYVDISSTIERKIRAFLCHDSQYADSAQVRQRMLAEAKYVDNKDHECYREAFRVMRLG